MTAIQGLGYDTCLTLNNCVSANKTTTLRRTYCSDGRVVVVWTMPVMSPSVVPSPRGLLERLVNNELYDGVGNQDEGRGCPRPQPR